MKQFLALAAVVMAALIVRAGVCAKSAEEAELLEFLRFPSVSTDPAHRADCERCADWLVAWLTPLGFTCEKLGGAERAPVLFAERKGKPGAKSLLVYGHYDVQPAALADGWATPPFEPTLKGDAVYARGASDNKGQIFAFLCGTREYLQEHAADAPTIRLCIEGGEESGSIVLTDVLAKHPKEKFLSDVLTVCDASALPDMRMSLTVAFRGIVHLSVKVKGAHRDLHSGQFGGVAPNALQGLAEMLASLHNADGGVAVEGFYDGVVPPEPDQLALAERHGKSQAVFEDEMGTTASGGERGRSVVERNAFRPTLELNGFASGYAGAGLRTSIPCEAVAKLSGRLVPGQDPQVVEAAICRHLKARCPAGLTCEIETWGASPAVRYRTDEPVFAMARRVLDGVDPRGTVFQWNGATIPVLSKLVGYGRSAPLMVGFGQASNRTHATNENFGGRQFRMCRAWAKGLLSALEKQK